MSEVKRDNNGRFQKGTESPNPGGRGKSKGIAAYIMEKTNNLQDLVDIVLVIALKPATSNLERQERRWAIDYLTDRTVGKPTQINENEHTIVSPLDVLLDIVDKRTSNE